MLRNWRKAKKGKSMPSLGFKLMNLFTGNGGDAERLYDGLEELLIEGDFGASEAVELVNELRRFRFNGIQDVKHLSDGLRELIRPSLNVANLSPNSGIMTLYLILGVNGVGKTLTAAKLAHRFKQEGCEGIVLAAGDTFRAAAIEQLELLGRRVNARVVKQRHGADPGAVIHDAIDSAISRGERLVIADTAGRMHNKANLVRELLKIDRICRARLGEDGVYKKILVIDTNTGQNGMRQSEVFHEAIGVDAVIMTKYDSSAKGGMIAAIGRALNLPFAYLGKGEQLDDLAVFNPDSYLDELLAHEPCSKR